MAKLWCLLCIITLLQLSKPVISKREVTTPPPLPVLPLPSFSQLKWQERELIMFLHFGVNTFTDSEWGMHETLLFSIQQGSMLTSGSMLQQKPGSLSKYTDHSVASSPWKNGRGDVVQELVNAAGAHGGIDVGLYLSPWDRHDRRYGHDLQYNEYYLAQLQELLHKYGNVREIWFDGAKGSNVPNMSYYFSAWFSMVKELQSSINIFSDAGPDVRWEVHVGPPLTGPHFQSEMEALLIISTPVIRKEQTGFRQNVTFRSEKDGSGINRNHPRGLSTLLDIYYKSVGRNCVLLFNVPPNSTGLISENDVQRLREFRAAIDTIFSTNLAENCLVKASSQRGGKGGGFGPENVLDGDDLWTYWTPRDEDSEDSWIEFRCTDKLRFNVIRIQEAIGLGQRVKQHEVYVDGEKVAGGTTVGHKRIHRLEKGAVKGQIVRIKILRSRSVPLISSVGLHYDPFWHPEKI
uniref:alpha-L-fucosidase n=1 Tax=Salix viminalis TaxID=40686 RepID=A0A6N2MLL0_SALVM